VPEAIMGCMCLLRYCCDCVDPQVGFKGENLDYQLISDDWKKLGFQSDDPMRDFRGTGIFGVEQLLFFADKCPQKFHYVLDLQHESMCLSYLFLS
jgi:hypothetical protein